MLNGIEGGGIIAYPHDLPYSEFSRFSQATFGQGTWMSIYGTEVGNENSRLLRNRVLFLEKDPGVPLKIAGISSLQQQVTVSVEHLAVDSGSLTFAAVAKRKIKSQGIAIDVAREFRNFVGGNTCELDASSFATLVDADTYQYFTRENKGSFASITCDKIDTAKCLAILAYCAERCFDKTTNLRHVSIFGLCELQLEFLPHYYGFRKDAKPK